ncbi:MAG TPA: SDR family NAD(P)-dependent oxidoreductase [Polyangiales bacterium]|nr:SDR family NAD(P)-dependent oxidoreductase [Polyangiales bacterium]
MKDVKGKVAVVTGAASGIGRGLAQSFAAAGMKVVLSDVEQARLAATCEELRASGADVHAIATDVSKPEEVSELARQTLSRYGAVHVLCNNAGVGTDVRPSWNTSLDDWNWVLGVNLMGVIHGIRSFIPIMIEQNDDAHVVNTASLAGLIYGENTVYAVSKFAVVGLSESIQLELARAGHKVKVSVLCPAWVKTDIIHAGRNRPTDLAPAAPQARGRINQVFADWVADQIANGLDPRTVGDQVLDAIRNERFYVLTHPEWKPLIEHRMQSVLSGANPTSLQPPGAESLIRALATTLADP